MAPCEMASIEIWRCFPRPGPNDETKFASEGAWILFVSKWFYQRREVFPSLQEPYRQESKARCLTWHEFPPVELNYNSHGAFITIGRELLRRLQPINNLEVLVIWGG